MFPKFRFFKTLLFIVLTLMFVSCSCPLFGGQDPCKTYADPGNVCTMWKEQECRATVWSKRDDVRMSIDGHLNDMLLGRSSGYLTVADSDLTLTDRGKADLTYSGDKFTLYAPDAGSGTMRIVEWDGLKKVSVNAGAGHVVESKPACRVKVVAAGNVSLEATATEYVFVVRPNTERGYEVQVAVLDGGLRVIDEQNNVTVLNANEAVFVTPAGASPVFRLEKSGEKILNYLDQGIDLFGNGQSSYASGARSQLSTNLQTLFEQQGTYRVFVVTSNGQDWAVETVAAEMKWVMIDEVIIGDLSLVSEKLQAYASAGMLTNEQLVLMVDVPMDWYVKMKEVEAAYPDRFRVFGVFTSNGQVEDIRQIEVP